MRFARRCAASWWVAVGMVSLLAGCGGSEDGAAGSGGATGGRMGNGGASSGGASSGGARAGGTSSGGGGTCDSSALETGLVAQQTGVSVDAFDCEILAAVAAYDEPDAMLVKAMIYVESRFDQLAVACPNLPCGQPSGWTAAESGCFGLMQIVPACGGTPNDLGLLPNGHPNLTNDPAASAWTSSIFHPANNIRIGVAGIAGNRDEVEGLFSGCTEEQYTLMAIGNYNSHGSTKSCTVFNADYIDAVLEAYHRYAGAAGYAEHSY